MLEFLRDLILCPLLFIVYINDININIESDIKLFADDKTLIKTLDNNDPFDILNNDLEIK